MSTLGKNVHIGRRPDGSVSLLRHNQAPFTVEMAGIPVPSPRNLAHAYLERVRSDYGFGADWLSTLDERLEGKLRPEGSRLRLHGEKAIQDVRVVAYGQTYLGLPVWEAGVSARLQATPLRVVSSQSTAHLKVDLKLPSNKQGEPDLKRVQALVAKSERQAPESLSKLAARVKAKVRKITSVRSLIYQYDPGRRLDRATNEGQGQEGAPPTLPLPAVSRALEPGRHYLVTEILFTFEMPGWGAIHWRAFIEVETGSVLYLRAFVQGANGLIFAADPARLSGDATLTPCSPVGDLNPLRSDVPLPGLTAPGGGDPQALTGEYIQISDTDTPNIAPPTEAVGNDFDYAADTDNFAAVNAYYHLDSLYRMVIEEFGFADYFASTDFPIPVDHRGEDGARNAHHHGNDAGCATTKFRFGLLDSACPVGYATARAAVIHEFGHSCLQNHICDGTFSWAHGMGDALAVIMMDPGSLAPDRFVRSPIMSGGGGIRRHDRDPAAGWSWGGANDDGSYQSTQILSTTLFRAYRSTGGDEAHGDAAVQLERRQFAARYMSFLMIGAVGTMNSASPPAGPDDFATALIDFDQANADFEGHPGGAFHKVIRWAFEKQGLYVGNPPAVDVYIDDGRNGEYDWRQNFWNTTDIWNRLAADGGAAHETPILDVTNYMYVRVKNRGTDTAENVVVRAYHCRPSAGLVWPDDWQAMDTPELAAGSIPSNGETIVGPFEWVPEVEGHECLLASVSADDDSSNADTVNGPIPHWRLVPFDNNIGQRNVAPVPGGDGDALTRAFDRRSFWVNNPDRSVQVEIESVLPDVLRRRGWKLRFHNPGGQRFQLGPRASRKIIVRLLPGSLFAPSEIRAGGEELSFHVSIDSWLVGGMSYRLDPKLRTVPSERPTDRAADCVRPAGELLDCLGLPSDGVKSARLRKVTIDITFRDEDC